ncbi:hypothetical protein GALMADRAFT_144091 [Galerina marginata CBS 339.88]|uniref:Uncharacterized protein n=1 Tax=Galerina marginata (strain CBS 339.88) TaxID=685588 RepID=A0A067SJF3_GALM3|nr:hypothetical protein GALMADRAFT_144091 [Galerina marginata CBS 339.88]
MSTKWTFVKVLYLYLSYLGLFQAFIYAVFSKHQSKGVISYSFFPMTRLSMFRCSIWRIRCQVFFGFSLSIGSPTTLLLAVNGMMGLRLYALYGRSYTVLYFLSALFLVEFIIHVVTAVKIGIPLVQATYLAPPGIPILGCLTAPDFSRGAILAWSSSIAVAVICYIMTIAKFLQTALEARQAGWRRAPLPPLAKAFVQDGTMCFMCVVGARVIPSYIVQVPQNFIFVVTLVTGAIITSRVEGPLVFLYQPFVTVSLVMTGSRLVLNLREVAGCDVETSDSILMISEPADEA